MAVMISLIIAQNIHRRSGVAKQFANQVFEKCLHIQHNSIRMWCSVDQLISWCSVDQLLHRLSEQLQIIGWAVDISNFYGVHNKTLQCLWSSQHLVMSSSVTESEEWSVSRWLSRLVVFLFDRCVDRLGGRMVNRVVGKWWGSLLTQMMMTTNFYFSDRYVILYTRNRKCMKYHSGPIVRWYMNSSRGWTNHEVMYEKCWQGWTNREVMYGILNRMDQSWGGVWILHEDEPIMRWCMNYSRGLTIRDQEIGRCFSSVYNESVDIAQDQFHESLTACKSRLFNDSISSALY